jgi:hypothetical protein
VKQVLFTDLSVICWHDHLKHITARKINEAKPEVFLVVGYWSAHTLSEDYMQNAGQVHKDVIKLLLAARDRQKGFRRCFFAEPSAEAWDAHLLTISSKSKYLVALPDIWQSDTFRSFPHFSMGKCRNQEDTTSVGMATNEDDTNFEGSQYSQQGIMLQTAQTYLDCRMNCYKEGGKFTPSCSDMTDPRFEP